MRNILITGGAGFVGSHIAEALLKKGYNVKIYDNFSSGLMDNLKNIKKDVEIIHGNILDKDKLLRALRKIDIVSHHAAQLEIIKCINAPEEDLRTNTLGTLCVLQAAAKSKVKKFINISSACVYGQCKISPQKETHPVYPNWEYGVSKLAAEKYTLIYNNHFSVTNLRYSIVYGEREWYGRAITMFLKRVLGNKRPVIFGNGKQIRDFISVHDVVDAHNKCLVSLVANGQTYNISTGIGTTIVKLAKIICEIAGMNYGPIYEKVPEGCRSRMVKGRIRLPFELKKMLLSNEKAKNDLNWNPHIILEQGIKTEFEWLCQNSKRWRRILI